MNNQNVQPRVIPQWMIWAQCVCFSVLYAIWALPETILIRHICLITGALLSIWVIYQYRHHFLSRQAIPVWLIVGLFIWATFHLFFLSHDFAVQQEEYTSIWKRSAIGAVFGVGFGLAISSSNFKKNVAGKYLLAFMYAGLLAPALIYLIKFILTGYSIQSGWLIPDYWKLYYQSAPFYIPKTTYVCFCLPALAIALGQISFNLNEKNELRWSIAIFIIAILIILFVFHSEKIKNGIAYSLLLFLLFFVTLRFSDFSHHWIIKSLILGSIFALCISFLFGSPEINKPLKMLWADSKVALDVAQYQQWKYSGDRGYPNNELGIPVSPTNYERISWGKIGLELIKQNPLGYGLIERSFGHLAKINWSDSKLHQTHSGWIDLALGLGIPGILLIFACLSNLLYQLQKIEIKKVHMDQLSPIWIRWILISLGLMWFTTEISQKVYFDNLIFWLAFAGGVNMNFILQSKDFS